MAYHLSWERLGGERICKIKKIISTTGEGYGELGKSITPMNGLLHASLPYLITA